MAMSVSDAVRETVEGGRGARRGGRLSAPLYLVQQIRELVRAALSQLLEARVEPRPLPEQRRASAQRVTELLQRVSEPGARAREVAGHVVTRSVVEPVPRVEPVRKLLEIVDARKQDRHRSFHRLEQLDHLRRSVGPKRRQ